MRTFAVSLVIGGFVTAFLAQISVAASAFRNSVANGLLCFIIPGYLLFYAVREKERNPRPLVYWGAGVVLVIIGITLGA